VIIYTLCLAGSGLILPSYVLDKLVEKRQLLLKNALPDALIFWWCVQKRAWA